MEQAEHRNITRKILVRKQNGTYLVIEPERKRLIGNAFEIVLRPEQIHIVINPECKPKAFKLKKAHMLFSVLCIFAIIQHQRKRF